MSERKGMPHKVERKSIKISPEVHSLLVKYCQSSKLKMKDVIEMFIESGVEQNLYDEKWRDKQKASERVKNSLAELDKGCHKLAFGKNESGIGIWKCTAYSEEGVVKLKVLGKTDSLMSGACRACGLDRDVKEGLAQKDTRIRELEDKIQMRSRTSRKVPVCNRGAILTQEGTAFRQCPKSSKTVSVEKFCKVQASDLPCALFAQIELAEGPK